MHGLKRFAPNPQKPTPPCFVLILTYLLKIGLAIAVACICGLLSPRIESSLALTHFFTISIPLLFIMFSIVRECYCIIYNLSSGSDSRSYLLLLITPLLLIFYQTSLIPRISINLFIICIIIMKLFDLGRITIQILYLARQHKTVIFIFFFLLYLSFSLYLMTFTTLIGDEPFFLLIAHSILHDRDIDLANNISNGDSLQFMDVRLAPQVWDEFRNGELRSRHPILLPLIITPFYAVANRFGVILFMISIATFLAVSVFETIKRMHISPGIAFWSALPVLAAAPCLLYSFRIYAEIPGALLCFFVYVYCSRYINGASSNLLKASAITFLSMFLKQRFFLLCAPGILMAIMLKKFRPRSVLFLLLTLTVLILLFGGINLLIYGSLLGRYTLNDLARIHLFRFARGLLGLLWDSQYGFLSMNPVLLVSAFGLYHYFKSRWKEALVWSSMVFPYYLALAGYAELAGGLCPRGRFLNVISPFLCILVAIAFKRLKKNPIRFVFDALLIITGLINLVLLAKPDYQIITPGFGDKILSDLSVIFNFDLMHLVPSFDRAEWTTLLWAFAMTFVWIIFSLLIVMAGKSKSKSHFTDQPILIPLTIAFIVGILLIGGSTLRSGWMEFEDATFIKPSNCLFFEEPYDWENLIIPRIPYICGVTLQNEYSVRRVIPVIGHGNVLEIIAKGNATENSGPIVNISSGNKSIGSIKIKSDRFESYFLKLPSTPGRAFENLRFHLGIDDAKDNAMVFLDKMMLVSEEDGIVISSANGESPPIRFGKKSLIRCNIAASKISQNGSVRIDIGFDAPVVPGDPSFKIRLRRRYTFIEQSLDVEGSEAQTDLTAPFSIGTGIFELEISAWENDRAIRPEGDGVFLHGDWAHLGRIEITPTAGSPDPELLHAIQKTFPEFNEQAPFSICLGYRSEISLPFPSEGPVKSIALVSRILDVWDLFMFNQQIGEIALRSGADKIHTIPLSIGKHTAEDKIEFAHKALRIPHSAPLTFDRRKVRLTWPPMLYGAEYDSLTFLTKLPLPVQIYNQITVRFTSDFGLLDIPALGLEAVHD